MRPRRARSIPWAARLLTRYAAVRLASMTDVKSSSPIRSSSMSLVHAGVRHEHLDGPAEVLLDGLERLVDVGAPT